MKCNKIILVMALLASLSVSCNKAHYDVNHVHGVDVEGEALLPLANGSFTVMDMLQRFEVDSLLAFDASGNMSYNMSYEHYGAVKMSDYLKFKGLIYEEHLSFENPHPQGLMQPIDTMVHFSHTMTFESDYVSVMEAVIRSGRFDFEIESNIGNVLRAVVRSSDFMDAQGNTLEMVIPYNPGSFGFNLDGLRYHPDAPNSLNLDFELYFTMTETFDENLYLDFTATGTEMMIQEMTGTVARIGTRNYVDTTFTLFPDKIAGVLNVNDIHIGLQERNTVNLDAQLRIDTALITGEGMNPFSLITPSPLMVNVPVQSNFAEVFSKTMDGRINAAGGGIFSASDFIINPSGSTDVVTVNDADQIDVLVDLEIPMAFRVYEVHFMDTIEMQIENIKTPEWVKKLTLELTFVSTIPFNMGGRFLMYDSNTHQVTEVLMDEPKMIQASYDGQATQSTVLIEVTEEKLQHFLNSDGMILDLQLDTEGNKVVLNANQGMQFFTKAKVEYDGIVEFENDRR